MHMITKSVWVAAVAYLAGVTLVHAQLQAPGPAGQIFLDNFDGYTVQTGSEPYDFYKNGNVTTVGVSTGGVTGQAGFFGVDFSANNPGGQNAFGGALNDSLEGRVFDLTGATLSVAVKSSTGSAAEGYFAIRVVDGAGDAYRSLLYNPTSSYTTFSPDFSTFVDNNGTGHIDLSNITEIDLIAYNLGDSVSTTLSIDDFQAMAAAPEPATWAAGVLVCGSGLLVVYRRRYALKRQTHDPANHRSVSLPKLPS